MTNFAEGPLPTGVVASTEAYTLVRFSGKDARDFLQRVLTQDVMHLGTKVALAGYCDPKGRLLGSMRLWLEGTENVMALMPKDNAEPVLKRLRMFVLRDDVTITEVNDAYRVYALVTDAKATVEKLGYAFPADAATVSLVAPDTYVIRLEDATAIAEAKIDAERALVILPATSEVALEATDSTALFLLSDIAAGIPFVWTQTNGQFVPQMINLDLVNGVSFTKGCYPGQEVVSRMKHIGKPSRRMFAGRLADGYLPLPGTSLFAGDAEVGFVVTAAKVGEVTYFLYSLQLSALGQPLSVGEAGAHPMTEVKLPYTVE